MTRRSSRGATRNPSWEALETDLSNGLSNANVVTSTVQQTVNLMKGIAREAHVTAAESQQLTADQQALNNALGSHQESAFGTGIERSLVVVYYEGQLNHFVNTR